MRRVIDVVIPVYRGEAATRRCLESVLGADNTRVAVRVVAVNDASPEPALVSYLHALCASGAITLLENECNLGFVCSANRGMALDPEHDVVLLNSDTEVAGNWLDRLAACAYADERIGTATPFSNNATICSYPLFCQENPMPPGWSPAQLDAVFARANADCRADLPTAVGFCMYIRRDCLAETGFFDEERFGRGYGEESDFCMRARKAGWTHALAADVFVFHEGSVSFGSDRRARMEAAEQIVTALHPEYGRDVQAFVREDPLRHFRRSADQARAARSVEDALQVLAEREAWADLLCKAFGDLEPRWVRENDALREALAGAHRELESVRAQFEAADAALEAAQQFVRDREADVRTREAELRDCNTELTSREAEVAALRTELAGIRARFDETIKGRVERVSRPILNFLRRR